MLRPGALALPLAFSLLAMACSGSPEAASEPAPLTSADVAVDGTMGSEAATPTSDEAVTTSTSEAVTTSATDVEVAVDQDAYVLKAEIDGGGQFTATVKIPSGRLEGLVSATTERGFLEFPIDPDAAQGFEYRLNNPDNRIVIDAALLVWPVGPETNPSEIGTAEQSIIPRLIDADVDFLCGRSGDWIPLLLDDEPFPLLGNRPALFCKVHPQSVYIDTIADKGSVYMSNSSTDDDRIEPLAEIVNTETPFLVVAILGAASEELGGCYFIFDLGTLAVEAASIRCVATIEEP